MMSVVFYPRALSVTPTLSTPAYLWTLRLLAVAGLVISGYLATVSLMAGKVAGCGSGSVFNCSHVMTTRWSQLVGVPVGVPAAALYATMLGMLFVPQSFGRLSAIRWSVISFTALSAGLAALWFVGLQVFWVQHLCAYCLAAHSCGIALAALILWRRPAKTRATWGAAAAAVLAVAGLITSQVLAAPPQTFEVIEHSPAAAAGPTAAPLETPFAAPGEDLFDAPGEDLFAAPLAPAPAADTDEAGSTDDTDSAENTGTTDGTGTTDSSDTSGRELEVFEAPVSRLLPPGGRAASPQWQWAVLQWLQPTTAMVAQVDAAEEEPERKTVKILNSVRLDVKHWPLLGSPDADYFFVEMLDYTCSHCRATHEAIRQTREAYGGRLGVVLLPTPLNRQCNPHVNSSGAQTRDACDLAKLSVAVWRLEPDKFEYFHHYLMTAPPSYRTAHAHAEKIVGGDALKKELDSGTPAAYIAKNVDLYNRAGRGAIPKMLFPTTSAVGEIRSASSLKNLVERHVVSAP